MTPTESLAHYICNAKFDGDDMHGLTLSHPGCLIISSAPAAYGIY